MDNLINLEARIRGFDESLEVRLRDDEVVLGRIRKEQFLADAYFSKEKAIELRDKLTALLGPSNRLCPPGPQHAGLALPDHLG